MLENILDKIISQKKKTLDIQKKLVPIENLWENLENINTNNNYKFNNLFNNNKINIIAEIKRASPSKGDININKNPVETAIKYQKTYLRKMISNKIAHLCSCTLCHSFRHNINCSVIFF